jgi:lactoylglutathione lyase
LYITQVKLIIQLHFTHPDQPYRIEEFLMTNAIQSYLGAAGIGVSDLEKSYDFYTRVCCLKKLYKLKLPHMDEYILSSEENRGSSVVLMHYKDGSNPNYKNNPVKLVFYTPDPKAFADRIRQEGLPIEREPEPVAELGNVVVGFARDPDGYLLEILQAPGA